MLASHEYLVNLRSVDRARVVVLGKPLFGGFEKSLRRSLDVGLRHLYVEQYELVSGLGVVVVVWKPQFYIVIIDTFEFNFTPRNLALGILYWLRCHNFKLATSEHSGLESHSRRRAGQNTVFDIESEILDRNFEISILLIKRTVVVFNLAHAIVQHLRGRYDLVKCSGRVASHACGLQLLGCHALD